MRTRRVSSAPRQERNQCHGVGKAAALLARECLHQQNHADRRNEVDLRMAGATLAQVMVVSVMGMALYSGSLVAIA